MSPPKLPRAPTPIPRDRDIRETKRPVPGSPADAAIGSHRPSGRIQDWPINEGTPVDASDFETMQFRVHRAAIHAGEAVAGIAEVRSDVNRINERVDVMGEHLGNVREGLGEVHGTLKTLVPMIAQQTAASLQHQTVTMTAKVDIDKAQTLAQIDDAKDAKKFRRDLVIKVITISAPFVAALATLITLLASRC